MPLARAVARLFIQYQGVDGYIEPTGHAWGLDFLMADLDRTRKVGGPYQHSSREIAEWQLDGLKPIPEINAVILAAHAGSVNMVLNTPGPPEEITNQWEPIAGDYWKVVRPPGRVHLWIKQYDGRRNGVQQIRWLTQMPKNPSWRFSFLRAQPPFSDVNHPQTEPVYFSITLNCIGSVQYQLYIPQLWNETNPAGTQPDTYYPSLWKTTDGGELWTCVDQYEREEAAQWARQAFEKYEFVYCRYIKDHLIFSLGDSNAHWCYYEKDLEILEGHPQIEIGGGQFAFHFKAVKYVPEGTIERRVGIVVPDWVNPAADNVTAIGDPGQGGGFAVSMEHDDDTGEVWPKGVLVTGGDRYYTPVLYGIQATRPALHESGQALPPLFDSHGTPGKLLDAIYHINENYRGSNFSCRLRLPEGSDELAITGNEKAKLGAGLDFGEGCSPTYQVTGYLDEPTYVTDAEQPDAVTLELHARDLMVRLQNKACPFLPSFGGWTFAAAFYWVMHESAGLPDGMIDLDSGAGDFEFPCPTSELILKFDNMAQVIDVADELARAAGRKWGINPTGHVFTWIPSIYPGSPDFILDETSQTPQDHFSIAEFTRDVYSARNFILVFGRDREGNDQVVACFAHNSSVTTRTDPNYIGDEWWDVSIAPDGADPWVVCSLRAQELLRSRGLLMWETEGKPTLFPGQFVSVYVSGIGVAEGSIFRILEKSGRLDGETGDYRDRFLGLLI